MKARITKRFLDSVKAPSGGRLRVFDVTMTGFGVTIRPSGRKTFFILYGPETSRRQFSLGTYGALTVSQARELARRHLARIVEGADPAEDKRSEQPSPSVSDWVEEYMDEVRRRKKHPQHDAHYLGLVVKRWGRRRLDRLTRREVKAEMRAMSKRGHPTANRWLASVRACLETAKRDGLIAENPAMGIRPFREAPPRSRVLSDDEFRRVLTAITALECPSVRLAFNLLLDTGARKSEVLRARWSDLDLEGGLWRIPSPKSGRPQVIPLHESTVARLKAAPRESLWVIPGKDPSRPRADLRRPWDRIRREAQLEGVNIHDLRRTFGLHVARDAGLHVASKMLRHSDVRVTERVYVPLGMDSLRAAMEKTHQRRGRLSSEACGETDPQS